MDLFKSVKKHYFLPSPPRWTLIFSPSGISSYWGPINVPTEPNLDNEGDCETIWTLICCDGKWLFFGPIGHFFIPTLYCSGTKTIHLKNIHLYLFHPFLGEDVSLRTQSLVLLPVLSCWSKERKVFTYLSDFARTFQRAW